MLTFNVGHMVGRMEQQTIDPRRLRKDREFSEANAARQLGCSVRSLQRYERKARTPDVKTLLRMGVLYDLDHREFRQLARFWQ